MTNFTLFSRDTGTAVWQGAVKELGAMETLKNKIVTNNA